MFGSCKSSDVEMKMDIRQTVEEWAPFIAAAGIMAKKTNAFYKRSVFALSSHVSL